MAHIAPDHSLLGRASLSSFPSSLPGQVDGLVGGFIQQATDWRALAAMTAGGLAYRTGRLGLMGLGNGSGLRAASVGAGLTAEVSTFEFTHRGLSSVIVGAHGRAPLHASLWRWNGTGGLRRGLIQSFITFGTLKGAGHLAQGENFIAQHLLQDSAMVLGHQASAGLGLMPHPTGNLAQQFLHAEAVNLQIGAGMALASGLAPSLHAFESGLRLSFPITKNRPIDTEKSWAPAGSVSAFGAPAPRGAAWDGLLLMSAPKDPKNEASPGGFLTWTGLKSILTPFKSEDLVALTLSAEHNPKFVFLLEKKAAEGDVQALNALKNLKTDYLARFALKMPEAVQALNALRMVGNRRAAQDLRRLDVSNLAARALNDSGHMNALVVAAGYGDFGNPEAVDALMPLADKNLEALSALHRLAFTGNEKATRFLQQLDLSFLLPQAKEDAHAFTLLAFLVRMDHPQALPLLAQAAQKQGTEVGPLQNLAADGIPDALSALQKAAETNFRAVLALGSLIVEERPPIPGALEALEKAAEIHLVAVECLDSLAQSGKPGALEALLRVSDVNPEALPLLYSLTESENGALRQRAFQVLTGSRETEKPENALSQTLRKLKDAPDLEALREVLNELTSLAIQDPAAVFQLNEIAWNRERGLLVSMAKNRLRDLEVNSLALQAKWNPRAVMALAQLAHWRNLDAEFTLPTIKPRDLLKAENKREAWAALHLLGEAANHFAWDAFLAVNPREIPFTFPLGGKDLFTLFLMARAGNEAALDILSREAEGDPRSVFVLQDLMKNGGVVSAGETLLHLPVKNLAERALRHPDGVQALAALSVSGNKEAHLALQNLDVSHYTATVLDQARSLFTLITLSSYANKGARAHLKTHL